MPDVITDCAEPSPQEIVAALHAEIAAQSPEHAALVAEFDALPPRPARSRGFWVPGEPSPAGAALTRGRRERADRYMRLLDSGLSRHAAARRAGIAVYTAYEYERDVSLGRLGAAVD